MERQCFKSIYKLVKELEPILNNDGSFSLRKIETIRFF